MQFDDRGIFGFDVSLYQDNNETPQQIDFVKMKNYGASFVIIKAGQLNYSDPDFAYNWKQAKAAGLPRSAYWFGDDSDSGENQAIRFWNLLKDDVGEGPHFIDYESGSWTDWNQLRSFITTFQQLSRLPNNRIGIYTGFPYWVAYSPSTVAGQEWFARYLLWLAWYTSNPGDVKIPGRWSRVFAWQDGTPSIGHLVGVESKEIDHNKFNGTIEQYQASYGNYIPTDPIGDGMVEATVNTYKLNIRLLPDASSEDKGDLWQGDKVQGTLDSSYSGWLKLTKIIRLNGAVENVPGYYTSAAYLTDFKDLDDTSVTLKHVIETYSDGSLKIDGNPYP